MNPGQFNGRMVMVNRHGSNPSHRTGFDSLFSRHLGAFVYRLGRRAFTPVKRVRPSHALLNHRS